MKLTHEEVSVLLKMECLERDHEQMKRVNEERSMDEEKCGLQAEVILSDSKKRVVSSAVSVADRRGSVWTNSVRLSCREVEVLSRRSRSLKRPKKRGMDWN
mgnify:CR=1 FL=1|jgi:hypothetical protein